MTAKERAKMRRLELENEYLRERHATHIKVFGDQTIEIIELKAAIDLLREILGEKI